MAIRTQADGIGLSKATVPRSGWPAAAFFQEVEEGILIDIVDPHRPGQGDAGPKRAGLAKYARDHGDVLRRLGAVIKNADGALMSLDLKNLSAAAEMAEAADETDIRSAFNKYDGNF